MPSLIKQLSGYGAVKWAHDPKAQMVLFIVLVPVLLWKRWQGTWALSMLTILGLSFISWGFNIYITVDDCEEFQIRNVFTA